MRTRIIAMIVGLGLASACSNGAPHVQQLPTATSTPTSSPSATSTPTSPTQSPSARVTAPAAPSPTAVRPAAPPAPTKPVGFSPALKVGRDYCSSSKTVLDASGRTHGFMVCDAPNVAYGHPEVFAVSSTTFGGPWKLSRVADGDQVLAAADDGTSTYGLFRVGNSPTVLRLVKRARGGATTIMTLDGQGGDTGALAAVGGTWWALWSRNDGSCGCSRLFEAKTMGARVAARDTGRRGYEPRMLAVSSTAVDVAWMEGSSSAGGSIVLTRADASGWHKDAYLEGPQPNDLRPYAAEPDLVRVGGVTSVAWMRRSATGGYLVVYADRSGGTWRKHVFRDPASTDRYGFPATFLSLAYSESRLVVGWSTIVKGRSTAHLAERFGGRWAEADVGDGTTMGDSYLVGLGLLGGRAQVVIERPEGPQTTRVRHQ